MSRAAHLLAEAGILLETGSKLAKPEMYKYYASDNDDWTDAQEKRAELHIAALNNKLINFNPVAKDLTSKFFFNTGELDIGPKADALRCWVYAYDHDEEAFDDMEPIGFISVPVTRKGEVSYWFEAYSKGVPSSKRFTKPAELNKWLKENYTQLYRSWYGRDVPEGV